MALRGPKNGVSTILINLGTWWAQGGILPGIFFRNVGVPKGAAGRYSQINAGMHSRLCCPHRFKYPTLSELGM